jgi:Transposase
MKRYIGLDVHAASTTMALVSASGKVLQTVVVETNGQVLIEALKSIAGELHVCLEEGTQSAWLYEILVAHVHELVVVGIGEEQRGPKSDAIDAAKLAERLRTGTIERRVYKDRGVFRELRELGRTCTRDDRTRRGARAESTEELISVARVQWRGNRCTRPKAESSRSHICRQGHAQRRAMLVYTAPPGDAIVVHADAIYARAASDLRAAIAWVRGQNPGRAAWPSSAAR